MTAHRIKTPLADRQLPASFSESELHAAWIAGDLLLRCSVGAAILGLRDMFQLTLLKQYRMVEVVSTRRRAAVVPTRRGLAALAFLQASATAGRRSRWG